MRQEISQAEFQLSGTGTFLITLLPFGDAPKNPPVGRPSRYLKTKGAFLFCFRARLDEKIRLLPAPAAIPALRLPHNIDL